MNTIHRCEGTHILDRATATTKLPSTAIMEGINFVESNVKL